MEVKSVNEINMNNEGFIYLNNNLKINAIKIALLQQQAKLSHRLITQCQ